MPHPTIEIEIRYQSAEEEMPILPNELNLLERLFEEYCLDSAYLSAVTENTHGPLEEGETLNVPSDQAHSKLNTSLLR